MGSIYQGKEPQFETNIPIPEQALHLCWVVLPSAEIQKDKRDFFCQNFDESRISRREVTMRCVDIGSRLRGASKPGAHLGKGTVHMGGLPSFKVCLSEHSKNGQIAAVQDALENIFNRCRMRVRIPKQVVRGVYGRCRGVLGMQVRIPWQVRKQGTCVHDDIEGCVLRSILWG